MQTKSGNTVGFIVPVYPQDQSFDGFTYMATGIMSVLCDPNSPPDSTELEFNISVILEPRKFTAFYVDVPTSVLEKLAMNPLAHEMPETLELPQLPEVEVTTNTGTVSK